MAEESQGSPGFNYTTFKSRLLDEGFTEKQNGPLRLRLELLKSFMEFPPVQGSQALTQKPEFPPSKKGAKDEKAWEQAELQKAEEALAQYHKKPDIWNFEAGSLTIVDLSCPFIDDSAACALFNICVSLFLDDRSGVSRIIALDEAHKVCNLPSPLTHLYLSRLTEAPNQFMTDSAAAKTFTNTLLSTIRQQRHLATRVIIATQEPTISPTLLDLSTMTIVHRFTSPQWLNALKSHLAGASAAGSNSERYLEEIFRTIVTLETGEALLFSPAAMLGVVEVSDEDGVEGKEERAQRLGIGYLKIRVRGRLTADGGRSMLAT